MKKLVVISIMLVFLWPAVYAEGGSAKGKFHYGESFTPYGMCKRQLKVHEAMHALKEYVKDRGLTIEMIEIRGRFIKLYIYKGDKQVDGILLDRKTGRVRSIY